MRSLPATLGLALIAIATPSMASDPTDIFSTGFEAAEGYATNFTLVGQQDWVSAGSGGNGIVDQFFPGFVGQQAYIGDSPPAAGDNFLYLIRPLNVAALPVGQPICEFSVRLMIEDSTNDGYDIFSWELYNREENRLFAIDFDNLELKVFFYVNQGDTRRDPDVLIQNGVVYELKGVMDFERNWWSASLRDQTATRVIVPGLPISNGDPLNLGDISALWFIEEGVAPGDNYMLFDDYSITAESRANVEWVGRTTGGDSVLRLHSPQDRTYAIEATSDFSTWSSLRTNTTANGTFDFADTNASAFSKRFYRAKLLVP